MSSSLSLSLVACSNDDQSLGKNNLASTGGGSGGNAGAGSNTSTAGSGGSGANTGGSAGAPTVEPTTRRICDGSDGITLGHTGRGGGQIEQLDTILFEVGFGSFYVDGHCNFWITNSHPTTRWAPSRAGILTASEEAQLAADVGYVGWPSIAGKQCEAAASDGGTTYLYDRSTTIQCGGGFSPTTPDAARKAILGSYDWQEKLMTMGQELAGPMRLRAVRSGHGYKTHPLTLSFSLASVALAEGAFPFGDAPLITDPSDLAALRALRSLVLADADPVTASNFEVIGDDGLRYRVNFRDSLPIENEHGLIPLPGEDGNGSP